jgi:calpain-7
VSAFEPGQRGPYNLKIGCSMRFELTSIPQEGSGMFSQIARGSWYATIMAFWYALTETQV